jgi:hypothetical protein
MAGSERRHIRAEIRELALWAVGLLLVLGLSGVLRF